MNREKKDGKPLAAQPRSGESERLYRQLLQSGDSFAIHAFGVRAHQQGRGDIAAEAIARAIALDGARPDFHYNLAIVLRALNRLDDAAASYEHALALKPDYAEAHNNLGNVRQAQGRDVQAQASFERALALKPGFTEAHYSLGNLLAAQGQADAAAAHFRACLEIAPADPLGAGLLLASLGHAAAPTHAPHAHLQAIYQRRAAGWEQEKGYRAPELVARALRKFAQGPQQDILDLGCGTGMVGALVGDLASRLDGVDLSSAMLAQAAQKAIYTSLEEAELVSFLDGHPARYDVLVSAATLIHFGDLAPVFAVAATALREDGLFVFTLFPHDGTEDFAAAANAELAKGGCYAHAPAYVVRLATANGFQVETLDTEHHEVDQNDDPIAGLVVVLRRPNRKVRS